MSLLPAFMLTLTLAVLITVAPRIVISWFQLKELATDGDKEDLLALQRQENSWVLRHFVCAIFGVALVAMMKTLPGVNPPEYLPAVTAGYSMMSFTFALAESLLAQKIAAMVAGVTAPAKVPRV